MIILKLFIVSVFIFGSAICFDQDLWFVKSTCGVSCSVYPSMVDQNKACSTPPSMPPTSPYCDEITVARKQNQPSMIAERIECTSDDGINYSWINQTNENTVQTWKCSDPQCFNCVPDKKLPSTKKPLTCKKGSEKYYFVTNGLPNIKEFYGAQNDLNPSWYRMQVFSQDCNPNNANQILYYPPEDLTLTQQSIMKQNAQCQDELVVQINCALTRCANKNTLTTYEFNGDPKKCNFNALHRTYDRTLQGCDVCMPL